MKATIWFLSLLSLTLNAASPIRITSYDRNVTLVWTNALCTTDPVYEVLRANAVCGPWQHVAYITNQNSFQLSEPLPFQSRAAFYQIAWVKAAPVTLDYIFEECYSTGFRLHPDRISVGVRHSGV